VDDWTRNVHAARGVLADAPARMPQESGMVRAVVYESWRRSKLQGLEPETVRPGYYPDVDLDTYLTRAVTPLVAKRHAALEQASCALSLTDQEGRLLRRWVPDRSFAGRLDALDVAPRFSVAESHVGTTSAITLLSGKPVLVRGPEHFSEVFHDLSCAGAPIIHPVTRRTVGSIDVTCRLGDTTPLVLSWVMELAAEIQESLRDGASRRERLLLDAYLAAHRGSGHPLVTLDRNTIISNAAAARMLGGVDQALLWEHASRAIGDRTVGPRPVSLSDGAQLLVETDAVQDGNEVVGAVLKLRMANRPTSRRTSPAASSLPGLVGRSARWIGLCDAAARAGSSNPVLLVGEPGSGRLAVAAAMAAPGPLRVADAATAASLGPERWIAEIETEMDGPYETLVVRHADRLDADLARATDAALRRRPSGRRVFATSEAGPGALDANHSLLDAFTTVLEVPALRERSDDLPALLAALTARECGDGPTVRWMPDAVQALGRHRWPGNVTALETVVRGLVARHRGGYVGAADLPPDLIARTSRRRLAGLEQAEADTIMRALHDAEGNKHRAAAALGIARSTLYRKVRALGLDLSTAAF
jgi:transcriptional regulator of acetoin/glycerol metabolism